MKYEKPKELEIIRHSLSHVMAAAIKELYPHVLFAIGPSIDNGFYYDIDFLGQKIGEDDLQRIEKKMNEIIKADLRFERAEMEINEALEKEEMSGQIYKRELIEDLKKPEKKK